MPELSAREAYLAFTEHPHYKYRGCAPDPDRPTRAAGNNCLSIDAWSDPSEDGGEDQTYRRARRAAAIEVCVDCPVMVQCLAYATSVLPDGHQAEESGVFGGMTSLERHRAYIKTRHAAPQALPAGDPRLRTEQRLAVMAALARHTDPEQVAAAAGVDARTANWQRARTATMLGLDRKTATRAELLTAAREAGLLDSITVVDPDADVPAVHPPGTVPCPKPQPTPVPVAETAAEPATTPAATAALAAGDGPEHPAGGRVFVRRPPRTKFTHVHGQLALHLTEPTPQGTVIAFPMPAALLESAA